METLCQKRIRNHLIFLFSDSLELPKREYFRAITEENDCIVLHIFDSFENTLVGSGTHIVESGKDLFIDSSDEEKRDRFVRERTKELENFRQGVTKLGGSYLALDESKNVYKELYLFFKKRQNN